MTQLTKKQLIEKISKEQKVDPKSLERMNVAALLKMDTVVPDDGDLLGGNDDTGNVCTDTNTVPSDETGSGGNATEGNGVQENGTNDMGTASVPTATAVARESGDKLSTPTPPSLEPAATIPSTTPVIGEIDLNGVHTSPQETPFPDDKVARSQGLNVPWKGTDAVVTDTTVIGFHPITGKPVRVCDQ